MKNTHKRVRLLSALALLTVIFCILSSLISCGGEAEKLPQITVVLNGNTVYWAPAVNAERQEISINGHLSYIETSISSYTLKSGETFRVRAIGDGTSYLTGDWSNSVTYTESQADPEKLPAIVVTLSGNTVSWTPVANAERQEISINGHLSYIEASISSYTLGNGETFRVRAIGDGTSYLTGDWSNSVTYTGSEEPVTFTVTFYGPDNEVLKTETVRPGQAAQPPTAPTPEGYRFDGWDKDFSNVQGDLSVKACYIKQVEVLFLSYDGTEIATYTLDCGQGITSLPQEPTRKGYRFMGWDTADFSSFTEDCEIKALWAPTLTVRFIGIDNRLLGIDEVLSGESATAPSKEDVFEAGYTFKEWDGNFQNVTSDVTVYAIYTKNIYTVSFVTESGATIESMQAGYGDTITPPTSHSIFIDKTNKIAYRINGWKNLPGTVTDNHRIVANSTVISEPVLYYENGVVRLIYTGEIYGISFELKVESDIPVTPVKSTGVNCNFVQKDQTVSVYYSTGKPLQVSGTVAVMSFSGGTPTSCDFISDAEAFIVVESNGALKKIQLIVVAY